jgi:hypothetical protein
MSLVGEIQEIDIDVVNITVKYPHGESGDSSYEAPAGLSILGFGAIEYGKYGNSGYSFSVTGDGSVYVNDQIVDSKFTGVFDYLERNGKNEYRNRVEELKAEAKRVSQITASTNSRIVTHWQCSHDGNDFNRRGGGLHLGLHLKLIKGVYSVNIDQIINKIIEAISNSRRPEEIQLEE